MKPRSFALMAAFLSLAVMGCACTAAAATSPDAKNANAYFCVGNSIAESWQQLGVPCNAKIGVGPSAVVERVMVSKDQMKDKTVVISTGASNNSDPNTVKRYVPQQMYDVQPVTIQAPGSGPPPDQYPTPVYDN